MHALLHCDATSLLYATSAEILYALDEALTEDPLFVPAHAQCAGSSSSPRNNQVSTLIAHSTLLDQQRNDSASEFCVPLNGKAAPLLADDHQGQRLDAIESLRNIPSKRESRASLKDRIDFCMLHPFRYELAHTTFELSEEIACDDTLETHLLWRNGASATSSPMKAYGAQDHYSNLEAHHKLFQRIEDAVHVVVRAKAPDTLTFISNQMRRATSSAIMKICVRQTLNSPDPHHDIHNGDADAQTLALFKSKFPINFPFDPGITMPGVSIMLKEGKYPPDQKLCRT